MAKIVDTEIIIKLLADGQRGIGLVTFGHGEAAHRMRTGLAVRTGGVGTTALELFHLGIIER